MIGIAIVVVLIVIGATLFLTLSIKPKNQAHAVFAQKELAQNIVDAIVKTVTTCNGLDFAAVLEECANSGVLICDENTHQTSCDYSRHEISNILDKILGKRKFDYRFSAAKTPPGTPIFDDITTPGCTKAMIQSGKVTVETPGIQPIPLYPGTLTLMLEMCTGRG